MPKRLGCVWMRCPVSIKKLEQPTGSLASPPHPPSRPARTICSISSPLLSLLYASGRPRRHSGRSALCRRGERSTPRRRHGQLVRETDAFVRILQATPGGGFGFLSPGCGWQDRITSRGAKPSLVSCHPANRLSRRVDACGPG